MKNYNEALHYMYAVANNNIAQTSKSPEEEIKRRKALQEAYLTLSDLIVQNETTEDITQRYINDLMELQQHHNNRTEIHDLFINYSKEIQRQ